MKVPVYLPSMLATCTGGLREVEFEAATPQQCLDQLFSQYPLLRSHLFEDNGGQREHVLIFINDKDMRWLENLHQPLQEGDEITILQAVSGG